ncbi:ATP-grasp domain-containing protein [Hahella aquimaris]|uniref:ATP-grasp domain-containing protein n=1 Tax=Hahella sp. HNIBRBA332 TaxID=3015983 RepID=UPI00273C0366|nr:ATP-grasp domain-containing protein [Hahella sp. HNIBRBA332]WLQ15930.1 ATP-grasp domain-containing protein [Hahella sp. HNIBRBA332]
MRLLFPSHPLYSQQPDDSYLEEFTAFRQVGVSCSAVDIDALCNGLCDIRPAIGAGEPLLYRGWMLAPERYRQLIQLIEEAGGTPITSFENYLRCHHLPGWYETCRTFTAETRFFPDDDQLLHKVSCLGWEGFFVKDFVKSNSTGQGSIARSPEEVVEIVSQIRAHRGAMEGGVALRRVEDYDEASEQRYFVLNGVVYSAHGEPPALCQEIAHRIDAPFYSIDLALRQDGVMRLVEIGDGQVSDRKRWPLHAFVRMLAQ